MDIVEVRVKGHIEPSWTEWLGEMSITHTDSGDTVLTCSSLDQSALYGIINRLSGLGLKLMSVTVTPSDVPLSNPEHRGTDPRIQEGE